MTRPAPILFLVYREGLATVVPSTVLTPLARLREQGIPVRLLMFRKLGEYLRPGPRQRWKEALALANRLLPGCVSVVPSPPSRLRHLWNDQFLFQVWFRLRYRGVERVVVHCRGYYATALALAAKRSLPQLRVIFDVRGLEHLEQGGIQRADALSRNPQTREEPCAELNPVFSQERETARNSDAIICVSQPMGSYVSARFGIQPRAITVLPNSVDARAFQEGATHRDEVRRQLGIGDNFVVAYSGGLAWWHYPHTLAVWFKLIMELDPSAHFLALTNQVRLLKGTLANEGVPMDKVTAIRVHYSDMPRYLAAADVGLFAGGKAERDRICCPVKFAEYLASGLPVIISPSIGDCSDLIEEQTLGVVLPHTDDELVLKTCLSRFLTLLRDSGNVTRERCRRVAEERLSWKTHISEIIALYERLSV